MGEGNFRLGDVKQVVTTEDFDSLDESIKGCQMETSFEDCVTKNSLETLVNICNCIPYNLKNYSIADEKVKYSDTITIINYKLIIHR